MRKGLFIFLAIDNSGDNDSIKTLQMVSGPYILQPLHYINKRNLLLIHRAYGRWTA